MGKFRRIVMGGVAATTAASLGVGGFVGYHYLQDRANAGAHGAVVDLDERNGMVLVDNHNRPAFFNYFDSMSPEDRVFHISVTTTNKPPFDIGSWQQRLLKIRNGSPSVDVNQDTFRGIDPQTTEVIRSFAAEFEELTGIRMVVSENNPDADIVIGGYSGDHETVGFASFPQEIREVSHLTNDQGFLMLSSEYLQKKLEQGNEQAIRALVAHEFGHNLGLLHPHGDSVETAMNDMQQDAVSRMSYNDHTFPAVAMTETDSGFGPLDIFLIREALRSRGIAVPEIHPENTNYLLEDLTAWQLENAQSKSGGRLSSVPALTLLDTGGNNTLHGTAGDDLLVSESGYCGLVDRDNETIELAKDGQPYCIVEGEFSVVRSGSGDDLILTANGTEQTVYVGTGVDEVALVHANIGNKTVVTPDRQFSETELEEAGMDATATTVEDNPSIIDSVKDAIGIGEDDEAPEIEVSETTLTLHRSMLDRGEVSVSEVNNDIVLAFHAPSGRVVGQVTLRNQQAGQGIDHFRVIDNDGQSIFEFNLPPEMSVGEWQADIINPAQIQIEEMALEEIRAEFGTARQGIAGEAGDWTYRDTDTDHGEDDEHSHSSRQTAPQNSVAGAGSYEAYIRERESAEAKRRGRG